MDILDRISMLLGSREQQELTKYLKINSVAFSEWKSGKSKSYRKYLIEIAEFFNISIDYLVYGKEKSSPTELTADEQELLALFNDMPQKEQQRLIGRAALIVEKAREKAQQAITMTTNINIYEIAAGAGVSVPFSEDDNYTVRSFPQTDIPSNADCGIYINGKSMEPKFPDGCIVWVDRKREVNYGDPVIAIFDGAPYCKIYQPDGLYSINPDYKTIKVCEDDNCKIFGKVIGFYVE